MKRPTTHARLARHGLVTDGPRILVLPMGAPIAMLDPVHAEKLADALDHGFGLDLALRAVRASQARERAELALERGAA